MVTAITTCYSKDVEIESVHAIPVFHLQGLMGSTPGVHIAISQVNESKCIGGLVLLSFTKHRACMWVMHMLF